jgi:hypothetical protein
MNFDDLTPTTLAAATGTDPESWHADPWGDWCCPGEDADGVPTWEISTSEITVRIGVLRVTFDDAPDDLPDVCRRLRAALAAFDKPPVAAGCAA